MNFAMQGVIHGKTIELENSPGIDDGRAVYVIVNTDLPNRKEPQSGPYRTAAGLMENYTDDDDAVLNEIYRDRLLDR